MFERIIQFINRILSFSIGNLFKTEINNKFADTVKGNKLFEYNKTEKGNVIQQNFNIQIFSRLNYQDALIQSFSKGNENSKVVGNEVYKLLKDNNVSQDDIQEKLSNPEFISIMAKANQIAYQTNNIDKRKVLSDLIYSKFNTKDDFVSHAISQAIMAMEFLTKSHLKLNALFYLLRSGYLSEFNSIEDFIDFYNKYLYRLIDIPYNEIRNIGTAIISCGCAVVYKYDNEFTAFFNEQLRENLKKLLTKEILTKKEENQKKLIEKLGKMWEKTGLVSASPTKMGKWIGKTYLHDILELNVAEKERDYPLKNEYQFLMVRSE